ncbi:MAG: hypothetical protein M1833_007261 [Piccolia ochrophora]|nr:MAG: hypothetical protein M1833_007261 [Piccolia ochrophora]
MRFSTIAALGSCAGLASATRHHNETCQTAVTSTVTVTATAGAAPPATTSVVTTSGSWVHSVDYSGDKSTVYVYPTGSTDKKDCQVAVYHKKEIVKVYQVIIIIINGGAASTTTKPGLPSYTPTCPPPPPAATGTATATISAPGACKTHKVTVGASAQLLFSPNQVDAKPCDTVEFEFFARNHTVSQSELKTPCTFNGGFDTGFNQFNPEDKAGLFVKKFEVTNTKPTWFYCKQKVGNHCGKGMVFGINPKGKMDEFIGNAKAQNGGLTPPASSATTATGTATATATGTATPTTVIVGLDGGKTLKFEPPFLKDVAKGTEITFDFRALNHSLTESSFAEPCKKLPGVDSDFKPNKEDIPQANVFKFTLDTEADKPRWFYCKQAINTPNAHCGKGMVFAINPKSDAQFGEFLSKAQSTIPKVKGRGLELGQLW